MRGWTSEPLGDLCEINIGRTPSRVRADYWGPGHAWVSISDMSGNSRVGATRETITDQAIREAGCKIVPAGTLLMSFKLSIGKLAFAQKDVYTNEAIAALPIKKPKKLCKEFLYRALEATDFSEMGDRAAKGRTLNKKSLALIEIPLPPLDEQRRIAAILDQADALRRARRRAIERLNDLGQAIFYEMFGDPAMNPMGWEEYELSFVSEKFSDGPFGSNLKSEHYTEAGIRVIRLQNIGVGEFLDEDHAYVSEAHFATLRKHECRPGDVVVGTLGDPNLRACIVPENIGRAINKADCVQIRVDKSVATPEFVSAMLNIPSLEHKAQDKILGQTRSRISMGRLKTLIVPRPPLEQQKAFSKIVVALEGEKQKIKKYGERLDALFTSLQHRAFRGEL